MDLRRVINLPADLDELPRSVLPGIKRFLQWAKRQGGDQSYTAQHRRAWWAVGLKAPAPIICTYMARRAPAFVRNLCDARHINIAPGRSEEHTSELQSLMRIAYAVFCLKKKTKKRNNKLTDMTRHD